MQKQTKNFLASSLIFLLSLMAYTPKVQALVQIRANYGLQTVSPDQVGAFPTLSKLTGFGGDLIISPPLFPLAFGIRHEIMKAEESNSYGKFNLDLTRTSGLISFRLIDTLIFLGAIGTIGVSHSGDQTFEVIGVGTTTTKNDISGSYSVGVEGGIKLVGFLVGAEVGYMGLKIGGSGTEQKLDGAYTKVHLGLDF
ncbi:MAG: hypothetical protein IPJ71_08005 [Bdellovibrionales bacterium]|nr:hypothetical protein [Bdellovibrionales bacterium]